MADASTGEILWQDSEWGDLLTQRDIHIPKRILQCRAVSREFQFSSIEMLQGLRLEQRIFFQGSCMEEWNFQFGELEIPLLHATNTWQQTIEAAEESKMLPAALLSGNVVIETAFFDVDVALRQQRAPLVFYDLARRVAIFIQLIRKPARIAAALSVGATTAAPACPRRSRCWSAIAAVGCFGGRSIVGGACVGGGGGVVRCATRIAFASIVGRLVADGCPRRNDSFLCRPARRRRPPRRRVGARQRRRRGAAALDRRDRQPGARRAAAVGHALQRVAGYLLSDADAPSSADGVDPADAYVPFGGASADDGASDGRRAAAALHTQQRVEDDGADAASQCALAAAESAATAAEAQRSLARARGDARALAAAAAAAATEAAAELERQRARRRRG